MNFEKTLARALAARTPVMLLGGPGIGKSHRVQALERKPGWLVISVIASIREPSQFSFEVGRGADGAMAVDVPAWARRIGGHVAVEQAKLSELRAAGSAVAEHVKSGKHAVLFLDEISCAPPAVQAACLTVVQERRVGDLYLGDADLVHVIAAANPSDIAAGGWDLALPLANRFLHIKVAAPTASEWTEWLATQDEISPRARAAVGGFIRRRPEFLAELPDGNDAKAQAARAAITARTPLAFGTPRSWAAAARCVSEVMPDLEAARAGAAASGGGKHVAELALADCEQALYDLVEGCVGQGAATEFVAWARQAGLPDPEALLLAPGTYTPDTSRPDVVWAVLMGVAAAACEKRPDKEYRTRWGAAFKVCDVALQAGIGAEAVVIPMRYLGALEHRPKGAISDPAVIAVVDKVKGVIRDSGILDRR